MPTLQSNDQKKQFLLSHGYSDEEADGMLAGYNPIKKQTPTVAPSGPVKAGAAALPKGLPLHPDALEAQVAAGKTYDFIADQMAMNSPHFASQLKKIRTKFGSDPAATEAFLNTRFYGDTTYAPPTIAPEKPKGIVGRTLDRVYGNAQEFVGEGGVMDQYNQGQITSGQAALRGAQKLFSGAVAPITELSSTVAKGLYENVPGVKPALQHIGNEITNSELGQSAAPYIQQGIQAYQNLPQDSGFRDLAAGGQMGLDTLDVVGTAGSLQLGKRAITQAATHPIQTLRHPIQSGKSVWNGSSLPAGANSATQPKKLAGSAQAAVDKGMDEKFMTFVAEQGPDTRAVMSKMTKAAKEGGEKLGGTVKHKEILGGQMMENAAYVLEEKQTLGKALGAMKGAVADDIVDLSDDYAKLLGELRNKGAVLNDKGKIISLAGAADDNIPMLQKALDFFQPDESGRIARTGKEIDMWRTKMFQEMNSAKAKLQPSSAGQSTLGFAEKLTNDLRRDSLVRMAKGNQNLIKVNDAYEELATQSSKFLKAIGYKGKLNPEAITAKELRAGEVALRTLGNASAESRDAFTGLIETAKKYGRVSNVDDMALIRYADALEDVFPITPTRSLDGQVSRATRGPDGALVEDLVNGKSLTTGLINRVSEPVMKVYDKLRGLTPENRYRLLMEVLDAPPDTPFFTIMEDVLPDEAVDDIGKQAVKGIDAGDLKAIAQEELSKAGNSTPVEQ